MARDLKSAGMTTVDFKSGADVVIINTCSVTQQADKETKSIVRRAKRANPDAFIVITGCYAQLKPSEIAAMDGVDLVIGAADKMHMRRFLEDYEPGDDSNRVHSCAIEDVDQYQSAYSLGDRTRAFLKVQDGCDYKCTYCTIPLARGISRSAPLDQVIHQAREIVDQGAQEVVLTGVNIGDYGKGEFGNKRHDHTFLDLLIALDDIEGLDRVRISSIEPNLLKNEAIDFMVQAKRFVPHLHIPLQSGSNELLGHMKRRYNRELFADRIERILNHMPDAAIGVDVIVGFPGETEDHFMETFQFLESLPIAYLHVFTYSERPNTEAIDMKGAVPVVERKARNHRLRLLSAQKQDQFFRSNLGTTRRILWEASNRDGRMLGYTENYVRVSDPYDAERAGHVEHATLNELLPDGTVSIQR